MLVMFKQVDYSGCKKGGCIMVNNRVVKLSFNELRDKTDWNKAVIVFSQESFSKPFTETERSYQVSSDAKYFDGSKIGNSLFGDCLDGKDLGVRLDAYMHSIPEDGMGKRWIPDYCYIVE